MYTLILTKYEEPKKSSPQTTNIEKQITWKIKSDIKPTITEEIHNDFNINKKYNFSTEKGEEVDADRKQLEPHVRIELIDEQKKTHESDSYKTQSFNDIYEFISSRIKDEQ